ncbi:P-loop containing nucleoside triphosphate hydrolase protein [Absidia repens]|uniref:p-loop containing nucleoside triphosphate hydrolase protein n=1 Tax=Absidia repens TaxID=90262 RepID=A0A1X2I4K6_9FUNG|nr:P-loop containing nucleoside triphosphate hydrolase protein [Absidia repens]
MGALNKKVDKRLNGTKKKKDPGLPNLGHLKQRKVKKDQARAKTFADRMEKTKLRQMQEAQQRQQQQQRQNVSLNDMVANAQRQQEAFNDIVPATVEDKMQMDAAATGQKDNSRKAYFREFRKVLENADVILEILDARDPIGTRTKHVERMIMDSGLDKKVILVLNKIDLVPRENVEAWLKYLRNEYPAIAFKASTQNQRSNLGQSSVSTDSATENLLNSSECLGADTLVRLLKNYSRNINLKTSITVGIIGYPNVGKSSVINSLKRTKVCGVGSTPGFTKVAQQITLDKNIKLLDCPGIVFAQQGQDGQTDAEIALRNCIKVELLEDPVTPVEVIVSRCTTASLMGLYKIGYFNNAHEFLVLLAQQRGKLRRGGVADTQQVARYVLNDWNSGKIPFYTVPPSSKKSHIAASVVSGWSEAWNVDMQSDDQLVLGGLPGVAEFDQDAIIMEVNDNGMDDGGDEMMMDEDSIAADSSVNENGRMVVF